jgi:hypothetical protein
MSTHIALFRVHEHTYRMPHGETWVDVRLGFGSGAEIIVATFFGLSLERVNNQHIPYYAPAKKRSVQEPGVSSQCIITAHISFCKP